MTILKGVQIMYLLVCVHVWARVQLCSYRCSASVYTLHVFTDTISQ